MTGTTGDRGKNSRIRLSFFHIFLISMIFLILVLAAGITYFDYRQAEETYQKSALAMQQQTEDDLAQSVRVVDGTYEILDNNLNLKMREGFALFLQEYEQTGGDPSKLDLQGMKEELGNSMDLYIINDSLIVEATTYTPDLYLDFSQWPYTYDYFKDIINKEGFFPDRVVFEESSGNLRKYAYIPTPDHHYILELGLSEEGFGERPRVQYYDELKAIALHNPNILSFRAFDTMGRAIGNESGGKAPSVVKQVAKERGTIQIEDKNNNTFTRYLFVDLSNKGYASDTSWIVELVYDQSAMKAALNNLLVYHALVALLAVTLTGGIALVLSRQLTRPVQRMVDDIDTIAKGNLDHPLSHANIIEVGKVEESITALVNNLKNMILQLHKREEDFRNVVETQTELIVRFLPDGTHVFVNEAYCRYFGISCSEMLGKIMWPRIPDEDKLPLQRHFSSLTPEHPSATIEHRIITHDNEIRWVQWNDRAIFDADGNVTEYQSVGRDNTEKKKIEQDLIESERKFRDLANLLPQVVYEIDLTGRLTYVNQPAYESFGYTWEELANGLHFTQFILPEDRELAQLNFMNSLAGQKIDAAEYRMVRKDGSVLITLVYSSPIIKEGKVMGIRGILVDITQLKQVEEDIRKLNEELERRVAERTTDLEIANRELEAFSYSVSHDLRAPLRAIDGFSSILLHDYTGALDPGGQVLLEKIRTNAQKMADLIDAILNFSRMSRQPLIRQNIIPAQIVQEILEELQPLQKGRQIQIHIDPLPRCEGDPALIKQVFNNIISNALKFTKTREVAKIEIGAFQKDGKTVYFVKDNGVGFDMKYADKLFSVFQRLHDEKEYEGTGIGLAIVYRIIERHGGKVWAEGEVDKGASFFFTLE